MTSEPSVWGLSQDEIHEIDRLLSADNLRLTNVQRFGNLILESVDRANISTKYLDITLQRIELEIHRGFQQTLCQFGVLYRNGQTTPSLSLDSLVVSIPDVVGYHHRSSSWMGLMRASYLRWRGCGDRYGEIPLDEISFDSCPDLKRDFDEFSPTDKYRLVPEKGLFVIKA